MRVQQRMTLMKKKKKMKMKTLRENELKLMVNETLMNLQYNFAIDITNSNSIFSFM
jgi:hypothetical protein